MTLNLRDFPSPEKHGGESLIPFSCELDLSGARRYNERPFPEPVRAEGVLRKRHEGVTVDYVVRYQFHASCARCLDPVSQNGELSFSHTVSEKPGEAAPEQIPAPGGILDIGELVTGDLLLSLTGVPLCSPECKGICPHCGANRNQNNCGCEPGAKPADPRFSALLELLEN